MSIDVEKQAQLASWIADVKILMNNLNEYLAKPPEGIDIKVVADQSVAEISSGTNFVEVGSVWQVSINATRTETLI
ncbi:hypothetical protein KTE28_03630 [Burkholderia multivorans]|uniref:hypothetical protein n=1 Tax=Burkholderia multivorans TaxID=87883 RepID=UPI001C25F94D|nr:hypothetical protein [Burkholderia multivorans]MBU9373423.1 hypothetical protein [Burkholderia multivorans]